MVHLCLKDQSNVVSFTNQSWEKVCDSAQAWLGLDGEERSRRYHLIIFDHTLCRRSIRSHVLCRRSYDHTYHLITLTTVRSRRYHLIISTPRLDTIVHQCETMAGYDKESRSQKDLDQASRRQDKKSINSIIECVEKGVNPFRYDSSDLVSPSSGVVATASFAEDLITAHAKGEAHMMTYISDRIQSAKVGFHETIPKLKLQTLSGQLKVKTGHTGTDTAMKSDRNVFARMIVLSKHREIDLRKMLSHCLGVVSYPLANTNASIAKTNKTALLNQIEGLCQNHIVSEIPSDSSLIVDLMAVVHSLPSNLPPTFGQLATYILRRILLVGGRDTYTRLNIVSDRYPAISIKEVEHS